MGGGTAGVTAAVAAAHNGAQTCLVERESFLGGAQTGGWVTPHMAVRCAGRSLIGGLHAETLKRYAELSPSRWSRTEETDYLWFDPVVLALVLDGLVHDAAVNVLHETLFVDAAAEERRITSIFVADALGLRDLSADVFVDCTGDAALTVASGGAWTGGREADGLHQPMTLRFVIGNVNLRAARDFFREIDPGSPVNVPRFSVLYPDAAAGPLASRIRAACDEGLLEEGDLGYFQLFAILGRERDVAVNAPRLTGFDPLVTESRAEALRQGRRRVRRIHRFLVAHVPGFKRSYVSVVAPLLGIRESRRVSGLYTMTGSDIVQGRRFVDGIANANYPIDIHDPEAPGGTDLRAPPAGEYYQIPYRSLVPRDVTNLLTAGRCIAATFEAQSAVRVQAICRATGQAAGAAAALCTGGNVLPADLDPQQLRDRLRADGCLVD